MEQHPETTAGQRQQSDELPQSLLDDFAGRPEIVSAYLFGSLAASVDQTFGELDLALLLAEGVARDTAWDLRLELLAKAEAAYGRRVVVELLNLAPVVYSYLVVKHGRLIFDRGSRQRPEFEARISLAYFERAEPERVLAVAR